jgi:hypothetical protein
MQFQFPAGDSHAVMSATAADGLRLPVVDAAHPAFAVPDAIPRASRRGAMGFLAWDRRNEGMLGGAGRTKELAGQFDKALCGALIRRDLPLLRISTVLPLLSTMRR